MGSLSLRRQMMVSLAVLFWAMLLPAQDAVRPAYAGSLTIDQIKTFLRNAKVVGASESKKGITRPSRLTLTDGTITHDASFQAVDEHKQSMQMASGQTVLNFVDSYRYNIAGYELAELIGLTDVIPVYVERKWDGKEGSLSWWLPVKMDEADRRAKKIEVPPNAVDNWNNTMYRLRVLDELVDDSDPNMTNVLIGEDWQIWRVDFTRAFRLDKDAHYKNLVRCDKNLLAKLKALDANELAQHTKPYLTKDEVKAVMQRRDKIVDHFQKLVAEKGEGEVLY